ncbi:MAG: hypothetical protein AAF602_19985 [Myxococcota bacterium]
MILLLGALPTLAQPIADLPAVASDMFRPSVGGGPFLVTESPPFDAGATGGLHLSWAREPLRIIVDGEGAPVVDNAVAVHLGARVAVGPLQIGVAAPGYVVAQVDGNRTVLGDPTLDAKLAAHGERLGGGLFVRLGASLGASAWQLGYPGPFADVGAIGDVELGRVTVAANVGIRVTPTLDLGEVVLDDAFWFRVAGRVEVTDRVEPALEIWGQRALMGTGPSVAPVEGLAQLCYRWPAGPALHAGLGTGLTSGVGSPRWRAVAGVSLTTPR